MAQRKKTFTPGKPERRRERPPKVTASRKAAPRGGRATRVAGEPWSPDHAKARAETWEPGVGPAVAMPRRGTTKDRKSR